jgi:hypothetical protein
MLYAIETAMRKVNRKSIPTGVELDENLASVQTNKKERLINKRHLMDLINKVYRRVDEISEKIFSVPVLGRVMDIIWMIIAIPVSVFAYVVIMVFLGWLATTIIMAPFRFLIYLLKG